MSGTTEIIIRSSGERTERECIRRAEKQGNVHLIKAYPFGACLQESYILALDLGAEYTTMIDADVLLYENTISDALHRLRTRPQNTFCLDGRTDDKIFQSARRAGVHIYRTSLLDTALNYIDESKLKPESNVREEMNKLGYPTWAGGGIVFGQHDYEQYYCDLWRKACCQTHKLAGMIEQTRCAGKWDALAQSDKDFKVINAAYNFSRERLTAAEIVIDKRVDYNALKNIELLGLTEKGELNAGI